MAVSDFYTARWPDFICISAHYKYDDDDDDDDDEAPAGVDSSATYCLVAPKDSHVAFVPCGHSRFCAACAEQVHSHGLFCPLCRRPTGRTIFCSVVCFAVREILL